MLNRAVNSPIRLFTGPDATAVDSVESLPAKGQFPSILQTGRFLAGMKVFDSPSNTKDEFGWTPDHLYNRNTEEDNGWHTCLITLGLIL